MEKPLTLNLIRAYGKLLIHISCIEKDSIKVTNVDL